MTRSTDIRTKVTAALAEYGTTASWAKVTKTPNNAEGTVTETPDPNSPYTVRCSPPAAVRFYQDGELVQSSTFSTTLTGDLNFTPELGDLVTFNTTTFTVLWAKEQFGPSSDNVVVAWKVILET
jgi:hypothetical protein